MAKNPPPGDGHRIGAVRDRSQAFNPHAEQWVKRDAGGGDMVRSGGKLSARLAGAEGAVGFA